MSSPESGFLFDIEQRPLYPCTMAVRALTWFVQFIFIKGEVTLTAVCWCNYQSIIGMLKALDKMTEVIFHIFV